MLTNVEINSFYFNHSDFVATQEPSMGSKCETTKNGFLSKLFPLLPSVWPAAKAAKYQDMFAKDCNTNTQPSGT